MKWKSFTLSESNRYALLVPKGCANAYMTLKKLGYYIFIPNFIQKVMRKALNIMIPDLILIGQIK